MAAAAIAGSAKEGAIAMPRLRRPRELPARGTAGGQRPPDRIGAITRELIDEGEERG